MHGSPGVIRVTLLVCAGVASGYLWRAALESPGEATREAAAPPLPLRQPATTKVQQTQILVQPKKAATKGAVARPAAQRKQAARARARLASATASSAAASARCTGCSIMRTSMRAGVSCMRRT